MTRTDTNQESPPTRRLSPLSVAASVVVAGLCLWVASRDVELTRLGELFKAASLPLLGAAVGLALLMNVVKCFKLGILLAPVRRLGFRTLFSAEMIGVLVDITLPFRLQELVRAFVVARSEGLKTSLVFGVEIVEKGTETLFLLGVLGLVALTGPLPDWLALVLTGGVVAVILAAIFLALLASRPRLLARPLEAIKASSLPGAGPAGRILEQVVAGMRLAAARPLALLAVILITSAEWAFLSSALWVSASAIGTSLTLPQLLGVLVANFIAFAVPSSTSASVGIYEFAGKTILVVLFGFAPSLALALVIVFHSVMVVSGALGGMAGLLMVRLSMSQVLKGIRNRHP